jgi:beta-phosphoglucomutase
VKAVILSKRALKGFIFDLDGVIVNTVDLHYHAWKCVFDELDVPFDQRAMDRFRGVHQRQILLSLAADLSEAQVSLYLAQKGSFYQQALLEAAPRILNTPVVNLLYAAKAHGLKVGLASSSINARLVLTLVHLIDQFDAIADGTTVCRSKPAPDIFVWVAGALNINPAEIVVVEDGVAGIEAAQTAGMFAVGINVADSLYQPNINCAMDDLSFEMIHTQFQEHPQTI